MKQNSVMKLMLIGISFTSWAQQIELPAEQVDEQENDIQVQPLMVVSSDVQSLPKPLQAEAITINKTAGGATIIDQDAWQNQRAVNIKDLLDFVPGVFVQQRNGAESARVSIRGSGLGRQFQGGGLQLFQDGIPLNTADGAFDFQAIDPWLTDYLTVYRGANGMGHGSTSLGGAINFGTTIPSSQDPTTLRLTSGSFNTQQAMISLTQDLNSTGQHLFRLRTSYFKQDGFRVQNQQRSHRLDLQYLFGQNETTSHKMNFYHLNTYAELPSSLSKELLYADPQQSRGFNLNGNFHRDLILSRLSYHFNHQFSEGQQITATAFFATKKLDNPVFTYINRDSDDAGISFNWSHGFNQVNLQSQSGSQEELRRENEAGQPGAERLYRDMDAQTTTLTWLRQQPVLNDLFNDKLTATLGLQGVYAERNIHELAPTLITSDRNYQQLNPRMGLMYQQQDNIQWFSNLSRSFEAPSFAELNNGNQPGINSPIKAQSADTFEIGTRGFTGTLSWDVAAYYSQLDNEFIRFRFPDGATRTTNANHSIHWGLESGIQWQLTQSLLTDSDQLIWASSYQWNQFNLDNDEVYGNNHIPGIPEHYIQSQITYQHPTGWKISPNIEWVPTAYYIDLANSYRTDNYLLAGLSVSYASPNGFEFYLDAKNLNNQTYISTSLPIPDAGGTDGNYFYSGEGRAFYAGLKWQF
ncbi:MAG: TonB-dependent receptor family protein [Marinicella sp.]